jgi:hypothetical protein
MHLTTIFGGKHMEQEICRREVQIKRNYKLAIILSASWIFISFMINFFIGGCSMTTMFDVGGLYWIGFGNMLLGLTLLIIFVLLQLFSRTLLLVLTTKRIYLSVKRKLLFKRALESTESHNLNKIVGYNFVKISNKKHSFSQLSFKTFSYHVAFVVDEKFYDQFVEAVNNAA